MSAQFNVAVIMLRNRSADEPPAADDVRRWWSGDRFSVARFWRDATYGWTTFPRFDYFGWYDVELPTSGSRSEVVELAKGAAADAGASMSPYDVFVAVVAGQGAPDTGAAGSVVSINVTDPHSFATHEFGHAMGFSHTFGIPTLGGDQDGDDVPEPGPVYGDPYCIMSARTFGGADPEFDIAAADPLRAMPGLPNAWLAGPPPARATVHFQMPAAIESAFRKVTHLYDGGAVTSATLNVAGGGGAGAELLVFHPAGETAAGGGLGRVYVELRMPSGSRDGTVWDQGLPTAGNERDRAGIIVHVVRPWTDPQQPVVVWYAGRIVFPTDDLDVTVGTPLGPVTISITDAVAIQGTPRSALVAFSRSAARSAHMLVGSTETRVVTSTETRTAPTLPGFTGEFTWEHREVTRTSRYRPFVLGLGGAGPIEGGTQVAIAWSVGGVALSAASGTVDVPLAGHVSGVRLKYAINQATKELALTNRPADGSYTVPVVCAATAPGEPGSVTGTGYYTVAGLEEGWGEDYLHFLDWWHDITNPIPIEIVKPRWWLRRRLDRIETEVEAVSVLNPVLAESMRLISEEQTRVIAG